jgi:hypothetical protein
MLLHLPRPSREVLSAERNSVLCWSRGTSAPVSCCVSLLTRSAVIRPEAVIVNLWRRHNLDRDSSR